MSIVRDIADNRRETSLAVKLRQKRFDLFKKLIFTIPKPLRILDVGGTEVFWEMMNYTKESDIEVVLFNRSKIQTYSSNFTSIIGDARNMGQFEDNEYDIVFSNSLIEHVGTYENQKKVADEIIRIGKRYFVQTPNYYFPVEPHFLFPFFQYLPSGLKVFLLRNFNMGWYKQIKDYKKATETANSIHLLKERELIQLFPDAMIHKEKLLGLTKGFILYKGW